jgi:hypothetical protein
MKAESDEAGDTYSAQKGLLINCRDDTSLVLRDYVQSSRPAGQRYSHCVSCHPRGCNTLQAVTPPRDCNTLKAVLPRHVLLLAGSLS